MKTTIKRGAAFLFALLLLLGLAGCGETFAPDGGDTDTDTETTTTAPAENGLSAADLLAKYRGRCDAITATAVSETVEVTYEVNGNVTFSDTMTAELLEKDGVFSAECVQTVDGKETALSLYLPKDRAYIRQGDLRYTLALSAKEVLGDYGILLPEALFALGQEELAEVFTVMETDTGYSLTFALDKDGINADAASLAELLLKAVNAGMSNAEITKLSITVSMTEDGDPTGVYYVVEENVLAGGSFITVHVGMESLITALNEDVSLTVPEDLGSYPSAEKEYSEIIDQLLDDEGQLVENAAAVREKLSEQYGADLVQSVLDMLGLSV